MKNLVWFCLGVVTGRGLPLTWHAFYVITIMIILWDRSEPLIRIIVK